MNQHNDSALLLAVGSVVILTWYGFRQLGRERTAPAPPVGPSGRLAQPANPAAVVAEFYRPPDLDRGAGGIVCCTACGTEYHAGVMFCDCGAPTAEDDEAEAPGDGMPILERDPLVCVYVADNTWKANLLKSYLEAHDITVVIRGSVASGYAHFALPGQVEVRLMVPSEESAQACALLRDC